MLQFVYRFADTVRHLGRKRKWTEEHATGRRGEDIAHRFLQRSGIVVVSRNYRTAVGSGEIDLVGWEGDRLVFFEVKSRSTEDYGPPDRAIGPHKMTRLLRAARDYARHAEVPWEKVRFDVVNVVLDKQPRVRHIRDAFQPERDAPAL